MYLFIKNYFWEFFSRDPQFKEMLELLAMLKKGHCDGLKVRTGRLQNLISSSCIGIFYFRLNKIMELIYFE